MATKATKPKPPRKPEQVWYDVHKHPEGVPGGMGKSPEHHLRNRGWRSQEIHGATNKTIQYHNPKHPDFVISYGGGSGTKPDHNFGITYLGTNPNIPKKHRAYSVADAMNKVEELHQMQAGHVVMPMTHGAAAPGTAPHKPSLAQQPYVSQGGTFVPPTQPPSRRDMNKDNYHPIGDLDTEFPTRPDKESDWENPKPQLNEIKPLPVPKAGPKAPKSGVPNEPKTKSKSTQRQKLKVTVALWRAAQEGWENTDYYHGTVADDLDQITPASSHGRGVIFPHDTNPDFAYVTPDERGAWDYAEKAWHARAHGVPRVYRVRATGPVEEDPFYDEHGRSRSNREGDLRSQHPFEVQDEMPMPEWMGEPEDWR